ncbi:MAG TPA: hydroxymethylglutaryl-CoA lyase [Terriglobia bacterium]|nr:hydroxymethylglutaryl-CoA lyase [Terriglobia bacterium]
MENVKIVECPRDAWQGLQKIIPTEVKADYLATLLRAGFRHLDAVSFVAPKMVPQMADSEQVMERLAEVLQSATNGTTPEIIGIVVNEKGLERALKTPGVTTLGYPYSISANFRRQNANMSLRESRELVETLQQETQKSGRGLVVYISMAFGNPFGEPWGPEIVEDALDWLKGCGVKTVSLADTVGVSTAKEVGELFTHVKKFGNQMELGVHLHSRPEQTAEKVLAAYNAGCRRFDSALTGLGGCPFAGDELVGNVPTEIVISTLADQGVQVGIDSDGLDLAVKATQAIRRQYA